MGLTLLILGASFLLACLVRKFASYSLLNGFMSKKQADAVFPEWKDKDPPSDRSDI